MNRIRVLSIALVVAGACTTAPSKDTELHDRLVGKWASARHFDNAHQQQSIGLSGDGLMRIERAYHDASGTSKKVLEGKWRVENGDFIYRTSESCNPECRQRIVSVTDWEWVMDEGRGIAEFRAWRYPK